MAELATVAMAKTWMGITSSADDALLADILERAEGMIRVWAGRPSGFLTATWTEKFDGECYEGVRLTYTPITSITSVKIYYDATGSVTVASGDYRTDLATGQLRLLNTPSVLWDTGYPYDERRAFPAGFRNIEVVYVGGYANQAAVPDQLEHAALTVVKFLFDTRRQTAGLQSENLGQYSYTLSSGGEAAYSLAGIRRNVQEMFSSQVAL